MSRSLISVPVSKECYNKNSGRADSSSPLILDRLVTFACQASEGGTLTVPKYSGPQVNPRSVKQELTAGAVSVLEARWCNCIASMVTTFNMFFEKVLGNGTIIEFYLSVVNVVQKNKILQGEKKILRSNALTIEILRMIQRITRERSYFVAQRNDDYYTG